MVYRRWSFVASLVVVITSSCGGDGTTGTTADEAGGTVTTALAATVPVTPALVTTVPVATALATTALATTALVTTAPVEPWTSPSPPAVTDDPASWIGRIVKESSMADPYAAVTLDGSPTGWVSAMAGCGMGAEVSLPDVCPLFVRADPGGYGHSLTEPGTWLLLAWEVAPGDYSAGGAVLDAVRFDTVGEPLLPVGQCSAVDGTPGVYVAVVQYDEDYQPTGDPAADNAAHPVQRAWRIGAESSPLEEVDAAAVTCQLYSFGD